MHSWRKKKNPQHTSSWDDTTAFLSKLMQNTSPMIRTGGVVGTILVGAAILLALSPSKRKKHDKHTHPRPAAKTTPPSPSPDASPEAQSIANLQAVHAKYQAALQRQQEQVLRHHTTDTVSVELQEAKRQQEEAFRQYAAHPPDASQQAQALADLQTVNANLEAALLRQQEQLLRQYPTDLTPPKHAAQEPPPHALRRSPAPFEANTDAPPPRHSEATDKRPSEAQDRDAAAEELKPHIANIVEKMLQEATQQANDLRKRQEEKNDTDDDAEMIPHAADALYKQQGLAREKKEQQKQEQQAHVHDAAGQVVQSMLSSVEQNVTQHNNSLAREKKEQQKQEQQAHVHDAAGQVVQSMLSSVAQNVTQQKRKQAAQQAAAEQHAAQQAAAAAKIKREQEEAEKERLAREKEESQKAEHNQLALEQEQHQKAEQERRKAEGELHQLAAQVVNIMNQDVQNIINEEEAEKERLKREAEQNETQTAKAVLSTLRHVTEDVAGTVSAQHAAQQAAAQQKAAAQQAAAAAQQKAAAQQAAAAAQQKAATQQAAPAAQQKAAAQQAAAAAQPQAENIDQKESRPLPPQDTTNPDANSSDLIQKLIQTLSSNPPSTTPPSPTSFFQNWVGSWGQPASKQENTKKLVEELLYNIDAGRDTGPTPVREQKIVNIFQQLEQQFDQMTDSLTRRVDAIPKLFPDTQATHNTNRQSLLQGSPHTALFIYENKDEEDANNTTLAQKLHTLLTNMLDEVSFLNVSMRTASEAIHNMTPEETQAIHAIQTPSRTFATQTTSNLLELPSLKTKWKNTQTTLRQNEKVTIENATNQLELAMRELMLYFQIYKNKSNPAKTQATSTHTHLETLHHIQAFAALLENFAAGFFEDPHKHTHFGFHKHTFGTHILQWMKPPYPTPNAPAQSSQSPQRHLAMVINSVWGFKAPFFDPFKSIPSSKAALLASFFDGIIQQFKTHKHSVVETVIETYMQQFNNNDTHKILQLAKALNAVFEVLYSTDQHAVQHQGLTDLTNLLETPDKYNPQKGFKNIRERSQFFADDIESRPTLFILYIATANFQTRLPTLVQSFRAQMDHPQTQDDEFRRTTKTIRTKPYYAMFHN